MPLSRSTASPSDRLFYRPDIRFSVPRDLLFTPRFWSSFSTPSFFPPNLPFPVIWVAGSLFVPPYGWPAVFTAPRFLPLRGFYRSAVFTAPRFFTAPLSPVPWGALLFRRPRACCPPVFPPLPGGSLFGPPYGTPANFTAPRFLPLHGFYRSAVFTAPRFLPLRGFYRSAVFTAPRFLPPRGFYRSAIFSAPISPVLWGALLFLSALQSSPSSGCTLCYRLLRRVSGGTPFLIFFLDHLLNRSRSVTAHLTGFPFVPFIHIRGSSVVSSSD